MVKLNLYTKGGVSKGTVSLPKSLEEKENLTLLAQAIRVYQAGMHPGLSKTKSRGEIDLSKRKIWRQKGTGRARHGARSAPIFVGGAKAHGPTGVKRNLTLPKKMRKKALSTALSVKAKAGEIVVVDGISNLKKTKDAAALLNKIAKKEKYHDGKKYTVALSKENKEASLWLRNLENVELTRFSDLNAYKVYFAGILVVDKEAFRKRSTESTKGIKSIKGRSTKSVKKTATRRNPPDRTKRAGHVRGS